MHLCLAPAGGGHRLRRAAAVCAVTLGLLAAGCAQPDRPSQLTLSWTIAPDPPSVGPARLSVTLTHDARPLTGARVRFEGNMTHPGMKPVRAEAREMAPGRYEAELGLTMGGDWIVSVEATPEGGDVLRNEIRLRVNAGAPPAAPSRSDG